MRTAASYGYSTFRYDRLGTGLSETPSNGFDITQAATETAILTSLIQMLRTNGTSTGTGGSTQNVTRYPRILGIGHSYGAFQLQYLTSTYPSLLSGTILQGFSANGTGFPFTFCTAGFSIASTIFPSRPLIASKPPTWLVTGTRTTNQPLYWYFPHYDLDAFEWSWERTEPVTIGTFVTIGDLVKAAPTWNSPTQVIVGDRDYIVAFGDAYASGLPQDNEDAKEMTIPRLVRPMLYPNLTEDNFEAYIPAFTGHAINTHFSAPETYGQMLDFVMRHQL